MLKKPRPRFLMMSLSALTVSPTLWSGCGRPPAANTTPTTTSAGTPARGGTWIDELLEEPDSLITNASSETFAVMLDHRMYAPLFYGDANGNIQPGLAT